MINCIIFELIHSETKYLKDPGDYNPINHRIKKLEDDGHKVIDVIPHQKKDGTYLVTIKYITNDEVKSLYKGKHRKNKEESI